MHKPEDYERKVLGRTVLLKALKKQGPFLTRSAQTRTSTTPWTRRYTTSLPARWAKARICLGPNCQEPSQSTLADKCIDA